MRRKPKQYDSVRIKATEWDGCVVEILHAGGSTGYLVEIFDTENNTIGIETFTEDEIYVTIPKREE